jgi:hypothetical protein
MSVVRIEHFRFRCDGPSRPADSSRLCGATSEIVEGQNVRDAAFWCESRHGWLVIMGNDSPLFTYCPEHRHLGEDYAKQIAARRAKGSL